MRGAAALLVLAILAAGCGGSKHAGTTSIHRAKPAPAGLRVGVVGALDLQVGGTRVHRGTLAKVADDPVVVVTPQAAGVLASVALAHPSTHFLVAGASARGLRLPNVAGLVIREDQAALLAGVVAGLVAADEAVQDPRVAWVGPQETALAAAFGRGVRDADADAEVLHGWSADAAAACKEAALGVIARGAVAVVAARGRCAGAAVEGAHEQNVVGLRVSDFELRSVAAAQAVRDALAGVYHGGEDVVFGAASGAVGVGRLDPRISPTTAIRARAAAQELASSVRPSG